MSPAPCGRARRAALAAVALAAIAGSLVLPAAAASSAPPAASAFAVTAGHRAAGHAGPPSARDDRPAPAFISGQSDPRAATESRDQQAVRPSAAKTKLLPPISADRSRLKSEDRTPATPVRPSMKRAAADKSQSTSSANAASARLAAAACNASDFASRSGSALVSFVKSSTTDCVNTLFSVTGSTARSIFNESQMVSIAYALRDVSASYPGNSSTGAPQLVLFLRAGYYVQYYDPTDVGSYGTALSTATQSALDAFFSSAHSSDVTDANGETLSEAVILIDSSELNARYLYVVKRLLNAYNSSYDASWYMLNAVNNVYTVLFRGHQVPAFVTAVQSDRSVLDTLYNFASSHLGLLSTDRSYLTSNAGRELGRFLQHSTMQSIVRPQVAGLLNQSSITGPTAALWVGTAEMTQSYDAANCSYYDTCNLSDRLISSVLTSNYTCSSSIRILAQDMTAAQLSSSCQSLLNQDAYFHSVVRDNGPVANDYNTSIEVVVFNSSTDYQTYAGAMYGIDTNNGGMYLEGDPSSTSNQPRFIAYEAEWVRPTFQIWNLNHEYTHYLDGRFDMYGDFNAGITTPTVWWIEGFAEYISYSYRNVTYTDAMTQAGYQTYTLRQLFDNDYTGDQTRIYNWGYLASRFMLTRHWSDMSTVLGYYRSGNWNAARSYLTSTIGTRYDAEFRSWLQACAAGSCPGSSTPTPTPTQTSTPTQTPTQTSTPTPTSTGTPSPTSTTPTTVPTTECTGSDVRALGRNCSRSNRSASNGDPDYLYLYVPSGTTRLTLTTSGGTGEADLYYSSSTWATTSSYTQRSVHTGNSESIVVNNPPAGYVYVSIVPRQAFSGVKVTSSF